MTDMTQSSRVSNLQVQSILTMASQSPRTSDLAASRSRIGCTWEHWQAASSNTKTTHNSIWHHGLGFIFACFHKGPVDSNSSGQMMDDTIPQL